MNEEITTTTEEVADDGFDGWDDEPVTTADEPEDPEEQTEEEQPQEAGDGENQPAPEQTEEKPEPEAKPETDDSFELKYMGETKRVGRSEAVVLAQKGMDYDRIRSERDSMTAELEGLRADKGKLTEYESFLEKLAKSVGSDIPSMIDTTLAKMMVAEEAKKGNTITEEFAKQRIQFDREKAEFAKQQQGSAVKNGKEDAPEKAETKPEQKPAANDEAVAKAKRDDEANAFLAAYPDVDPKSIPKEVMDKWRGGVPLLNAYMAWENKKLKAELEALEQNTKNSARSSGSAKSAGAGRVTDPFFAGWDD